MDYFKRIRAFVRFVIGGGSRKAAVAALFASVLIVVSLAVLAFINEPPRDFPRNTVFTIREGSSISSVARDLKQRGLIRSSDVFQRLVILLGHEKNLIAGDYYFPEAAPLYTVLTRISAGAYGMVPLRITIPEGYSVDQIADLFASRFGWFDRERFIEIARSKEGYLFPDTYFFMPNAEADDVVILLSDNFDAKIADLADEIRGSKRTIQEIVTMASILEEEAQTPEDRRIVSGILWKRIEEGMPLQVDATFQYVNGKGTYELTDEDLATDSPYNTYKYKGLPPGPISNPGLDAIEAALEPTTTPYFYYLSDKSGKIYYAKDFEGHKRNRELYLEK